MPISLTNHLRAYTPASLNTPDPASNVKVTNWANSIGAGPLTSNSGSQTPIVSYAGGRNASFGLIHVSDGSSANLADLGVGPVTNPGRCLVAGVHSFSRGQDQVETYMTPWAISYSDRLYMRRGKFADSFKLSIRGLIGAVDSLVLQTNEAPPAGKFAYVLRTSPTGTRMITSTGKTHTGVVAPDSITSSEAQFLFVAQPAAGGNRFVGQMNQLHFASNSSDQQTDALMQTALADLMTEEGIPNIGDVRTLVVVAGDSEFAGRELDGGQSPAGYLAARYPLARVVNISQGGASAASTISTQLGLLTDSAITLGRAWDRKILLVSVGTNEAIQVTPGSPSSADLQTIISTASAAGYQVVFADVLPVSNRSGVDATVAAYEAARAVTRTRLLAVTGATALRYGEDVALKPTPAGGSDAQIATAVRAITQGQFYAIPAAATFDWNTRTYYDELHLNDKAWNNIILPQVYETLDPLVLGVPEKFRLGTRVSARPF